MADDGKRKLDDTNDSGDEDDGWIGPMPSEFSKPKKKKGSLQYIKQFVIL